MFDVKTALLLWSVEGLTLAVILLAAWTHDRGTKAYLLWSVALAAHAVGVAMVAARGHIPDVLSIEVANAVALSAYAFGTAGLRLMDRRPMSPICALPVAIWTAAMFVPVIRDNLGHRVSVFNIAAATGSLVLGISLWPEGFATVRTRRRLALVFFGQAVVAIAAAVQMLFRPAHTIDAIATAPLTALTAAFFVVLTILFAAKMLIEQSEQRLRDLACIDTLTGVLNRRGFFDRFAACRQTATREGRQLALLLFDLDHFKQINDRYGHTSGDEVLMAFSRLATEAIGARGAFGRLGGEEFAAVLAADTVEDARQMAETIRRSLAGRQVIAAGLAIGATVSTGVAIGAPATATADQMMSAADKALYAAKDHGRNCVVIAGDYTAEMDTDAQVAALRQIVAGRDNADRADPRATSLTGS